MCLLQGEIFMKNEKTRLILLREDKSSLPKRGGNYVSDESIQLKQQEELKKELSRMHTSEAEIRADERAKWITEEEDHPFHWGEGSC